MARNHTRIAAPIDTVWAVLADPRQYDRFVVGTKVIRRFDPTWPQEGAELHHSVGTGPAVLRDRTTVVTSQRPTSLRLHAGTRPVAVNEVAFSLEPVGSGTTAVTLDEAPIEGPASTVWNPLFDALLHLRNAEVLRRLRQLAEHRAATAAGAGAARR